MNEVELQDINPLHYFCDAMEKQMCAVGFKRAKILKAEGTRAQLTLEVKCRKMAEINKAEGEKQAQILRAEGEAEIRSQVVNTEAEFIRRMSDGVVGLQGNRI